MPISLFYHYTDLEDVELFARDLRSFGMKHNLAGRIRISSEGINGTFGGTESAVQAFHAFIGSRLNSPDVDFKVSEGSERNFPEGWKVRVCKELVTMGIEPEVASWKQAAPHVAPEQFREEILNRKEDVKENLIVLDVRNQYESAIGRFKGAILPPIRQFSDFPQYVRTNEELFRGRRVLMYCTGGIRCERASAFLASKGIAKSIVQLRGGIDRFLNRFPDGGNVFEGKNLVFDTRMVQPISNPTIVGRCIICSTKWDDYSNNFRCAYCRVRVLICNELSCTGVFIENRNGLCLSCRLQERHSDVRNKELTDGP
ncbi:Thiosulfate sulfurtransferase/rhodanese-like domain-containing protein 2 [Gracilariopsis chorda]|uniref:Thiosulfate sulfurtransferase/rhodanese-like domain-containing protein 2 n=1 Tax=Gracilariopsis chorda TaxID=448386 RepID=A0A2V3IMR4_9FLOR|nr:Thiosulfate sulfurtransferase/rhodanese-like domain-containing protein 2 [Gracilariopsis chorda]|eukprot:PXF43339.1 Thiosulfate sulfurtransferase/rhodanese-like domain-containing protein 2 [Gracilariopsis chorda]